MVDKKGNPNLKNLESNNIIYDGRLFILYPWISTNIKSTYRCQYYRKDEKKLQEAGEEKFCKSTIIHYFPNSNIIEKYIFKTKHSFACDLL